MSDKQNGKRIPKVKQSEARFRDPTERNYTIFPNEVFFQYQGLTAGARWLYCILRSYAYADKRYCYPTITGLAKVQDCTEQTIRNRLKELAEYGLITVEKVEGYRNIYWLEPIQETTPQNDLTPQPDCRGESLRSTSSNDSSVIKKNENERAFRLSFEDKTDLIEHLHDRWDGENTPLQSRLTLLRPWSLEVIQEAAEITANAQPDEPFAYLYAILRRQPTRPAEYASDEPLSDEEFAAAREQIDRINEQQPWNE